MKINNIEFRFDLKDLAMVAGFIFGLGAVWTRNESRAQASEQAIQELQVEVKELPPAREDISKLTGVIQSMQIELHEMHDDIRNNLRPVMLRNSRAGLSR